MVYSLDPKGAGTTILQNYSVIICYVTPCDIPENSNLQAPFTFQEWYTGFREPTKSLSTLWHASQLNTLQNLKNQAWLH